MSLPSKKCSLIELIVLHYILCKLIQYIFELEEYLMLCLILSHCARQNGVLVGYQHLRSRVRSDANSRPP